MSNISKLPLELRNLSKDFQESSVPYSGWPPPIKILSIQSLNQVVSEDLASDQIDLPTKIDRKPYFEKLRSSVNKKLPVTIYENVLDNVFENLIGSNSSCGAWHSENTKNIKSPVDIFLSQVELLKHDMTKSIKNEESIFSIMTIHGNILFDFSKQLINSKIYIELMQLIRLSNLDKFIKKVFHKSGYLNKSIL